MWYVWLAVVASCGRWLTTLCAFVCDEGPATRITTPTGRAILVCAPIASLACGTRFIRVVSVGALQIGLRYNGVIDNLVILNRQVCVCVCVCVCVRSLSGLHTAMLAYNARSFSRSTKTFRYSATTRWLHRRPI
jgi:hypothetical protein